MIWQHGWYDPPEQSYTNDICTTTTIPQQVKAQHLHFRFHANYFFTLIGRFLKKLADEQCSSITKGSIYCIKYVNKTFHHESDWPEIAILEVSIKYLTFADTALLPCLLGRAAVRTTKSTLHATTHSFRYLNFSKEHWYSCLVYFFKTIPKKSVNYCHLIE